MLNRARTRASREGRLVGLPSLLDGTEPGGRAVDVSEFKPDGHWLEAPRLWDELDPERIVGGRQLWSHVMEAIERLPAGQRAVIILRDMEGCEAEEACSLLGISAENQRVLLHRARGRHPADDRYGHRGAADRREWRRRPATRRRQCCHTVDRLGIARMAGCFPRAGMTIYDTHGEAFWRGVMAVKKAAAVRPARGQAAKAVEARPVAQERSAGGDSTGCCARRRGAGCSDGSSSKNPFTR